MKNEKLILWQERLVKNEDAYSEQLINMDTRDKLLSGNRDITNICTSGGSGIPDEANHVRNIIDELIEAQVDSNIPQPKVTAVRPEDEKKAKLIEDMLRNELNRLPMEVMNDMQERLVPLHGSSFYWLDWNNTDCSHQTIGEIVLSVLHPKKVIPQDGVIGRIEDMDYIIIKTVQTKEYIRRRYGVDVSDESESEPELRGENAIAADDMVTQYLAYYRNNDGGIGLYSWVMDTELIDMPDYQARHLRRCAKCGEVILGEGKAADQTDMIGRKNTNMDEVMGERCPACGSKKIVDSTEEYEEIYQEFKANGKSFPGVHQEKIDTGKKNKKGEPIYETKMVPTYLPYYKPNLFPIIEQKNVSSSLQFLGISDADKISDQQNTMNILASKINDKLMKATSYVLMPPDTRIKTDGSQLNYIYPEDPAAASMIRSITTEGNISQDLSRMMHVYEEARQIVGITDSFQGRRDTTATSGVAKRFAAAQAAGRLESKRIMKNAAFAQLFELMFKLKLAYADEPRHVVSEDVHGKKTFSKFDRYNFLEQDEAGEWYWNDQFLFSCDTSAPLAANREAMWQEQRMNFQSGAFGNPRDPRTLILFWTKMEMLHYPGASHSKAYLEEQLKKMEEEKKKQQKAQEEAMKQKQAMMQKQGSPQVPPKGGPQGPSQGMPPGMPPGGAPPKGMPSKEQLKAILEQKLREKAAAEGGAPSPQGAPPKAADPRIAAIENLAREKARADAMAKMKRRGR